MRQIGRLSVLHINANDSVQFSLIEFKIVFSNSPLFTRCNADSEVEINIFFNFIKLYCILLYFITLTLLYYMCTYYIHLNKLFSSKSFSSWKLNEWVKKQNIVTIQPNPQVIKLTVWMTAWRRVSPFTSIRYTKWYRILWMDFGQIVNSSYYWLVSDKVAYIDMDIGFNAMYNYYFTTIASLCGYYHVIFMYYFIFQNNQMTWNEFIYIN